jgi:hypothetical protein
LAAKNPWFGGLEKLGFPWILSSESSLFNGLQWIFAEEKYSRPFAAAPEPRQHGVMILARGKGRIGHKASLISFLISCQKLLYAFFSPSRAPFDWAQWQFPLTHSAAAAARSSPVGAIRPDTAAPASGLSLAKTNTDRLEMTATRTSASERSRAMSSESPKPN